MRTLLLVVLSAVSPAYALEAMSDQEQRSTRLAQTAAIAQSSPQCLTTNTKATTADQASQPCVDQRLLTDIVAVGNRNDISNELSSLSQIKPMSADDRTALSIMLSAQGFNISPSDVSNLFQQQILQQLNPDPK